MKNHVYILDACAIIALINDENGAENIANLWLQASKKECSIRIHRINLLEAYYIISKEKGEKEAKTIVELINADKSITIEDTLAEIFYRAGQLKCLHRMSIADAVAIATTIALSEKDNPAKLVTADYKDIKPLEKSGAIDSKYFHWFR